MVRQAALADLPFFLSSAGNDMWQCWSSPVPVMHKSFPFFFSYLLVHIFLYTKTVSSLQRYYFVLSGSSSYQLIRHSEQATLAHSPDTRSGAASPHSRSGSPSSSLLSSSLSLSASSALHYTPLMMVLAELQTSVQVSVTGLAVASRLNVLMAIAMLPSSSSPRD